MYFCACAISLDCLLCSHKVPPKKQLFAECVASTPTLSMQASTKLYRALALWWSLVTWLSTFNILSFCSRYCHRLCHVIVIVTSVYVYIAPKKAVTKFYKCACKSTKVDEKCIFNKKCKTEAIIYKVEWIPTSHTYLHREVIRTSFKENKSAY